MSLWSRIWRHRASEPNRYYRRALSRLSRPERAEITRIIRQLKRLPLQDRADVVARLPEHQRATVERYL